MIPAADEAGGRLRTAIAATLGLLAAGGSLHTDAAETRSSTAFRHGDVDILVTSIEEDQPGVGRPRVAYVVSATRPPEPPVERRGEVSGPLVRSWVSDLDGDGRFEVILWAQSFGSGSYGDLVFMEWTGTGFEQHALPEIEDRDRSGYLGHDRFEILDRTVNRSFPVYRASDANCCPSGGRATLIYEYAGKRLRLLSTSTSP